MARLRPEDIVVLRPLAPGAEFLMKRVDGDLKCYTRFGQRLSPSMSPSARKLHRRIAGMSERIVASLYNREAWIASWDGSDIILVDLRDHIGSLYNHSAFLVRADVTGLPRHNAVHIGDPIPIADALWLCQDAPGAMWTVEREKNVVFRAVALRPEAGQTQPQQSQRPQTSNPC